MKVLYLSADLGIPVLGSKGGAIHIRSLIAAFSRANHEVLLVTPALNKSPWEATPYLGGRLLHIPPNDEIKDAALALKAFSLGIGSDCRSVAGQVRRILYNQQLTTRLIRKFDSHPPEFIYERCSLFSTAGVELAAAIDRPLIVELNAPLAQEQAEYRGSALNQLATDAEEWTLSRASAVLAVSEEVRNYAIAIGVAPERVHVVPNGVDPDLFRQRDIGDDSNANGGTNTAPVVGFVGGLKPWHGVEVLPDLLASLKSDFPTLTLTIVGDGPMRTRLQERFDALGLASHVTFTGSIPHDQVAKVMSTFDIAVAPYPKLNHDFYFSPLKLFEYMACGIPVVAPAVGQIPNVVEDEVHGLLYPPANSNGLIDCCRKLLSNAGLRLSLGQAAATFVTKHYTWDRNVSRIVEIAKETRSPLCREAIS